MSHKLSLIACLGAAFCLWMQPVQAKKLNIIYIPLDNRPVCSDYVQQTMEATGCNIIMPPEKFIASGSNNGDPEAIWDWLQNKAPKADAAVISTDSLIYGGLVASRTHHIPQEVLTARLERLNALQHKLPIKLYVFSTIMRTPRASFGRVEPPYYSKFGPAIFAYSELLDKADSRTLPLTEQLTKQALERNLHHADLGDWLERRQKNLDVNYELTAMANNGRFHYLAIGKDDNAPLSATHLEARKINFRTFNMDHSVFQILPGVDQLGLLLLTRAYNEAHGITPSVYPLYSGGVGAATLPQYSDVRLQDSVPQQIDAAGAVVAATAAEADLVLALNTPPDGVVRDSTAGSNQFFASAENKKFVQTIKNTLDNGAKVSLADVSYSNGADNGFMDQLTKAGQLERLTAYNGWNTADNTVGYAISQGLLAADMSKNASDDLMRQRIIDDWFYQSNARCRISVLLEQYSREDLKYDLGAGEKPILKEVTSDCNALAKKYSFTRNTDFSLSFPWHRLFEVNVNINSKHK